MTPNYLPNKVTLRRERYRFFFFLVPNEFFNKSTPNAPKHCVTGDRDEGEAQHEKGRASATQQGRDKDTLKAPLI